jgi:hypothetical protein
MDTTPLTRLPGKSRRREINDIKEYHVLGNTNKGCNTIHTRERRNCPLKEKMEWPTCSSWGNDARAPKNDLAIWVSLVTIYEHYLVSILTGTDPLPISKQFMQKLIPSFALIGTNLPIKRAAGNYFIIIANLITK